METWCAWLLQHPSTRLSESNTLIQALLLSLLLACTPPAAPTWPPGAALQATLPAGLNADGEYWIELAAPSALGARHRDFDVYELGFNGKISTTTEFHDPADRPKVRVSKLKLNGSQTLTYRACDYAGKRTTPTLTLDVVVPPPLETEAAE